MRHLESDRERKYIEFKRPPPYRHFMIQPSPVDGMLLSDDGMLLSDNWNAWLSIWLLPE
jgi:hypothetical protein